MKRREVTTGLFALVATPLMGLPVVQLSAKRKAGVKTHPCFEKDHLGYNLYPREESSTLGKYSIFTGTGAKYNNRVHGNSNWWYVVREHIYPTIDDNLSDKTVPFHENWPSHLFRGWGFPLIFCPFCGEKL